MRRGSGVQVAVLVTLFAISNAAFADDAEDLERAQKLAWNKQFSDAEKIYREVLARSPQSRDAALGLARVILWEGHYADARERFLALGDREGAATAAYWQGDFRTAAREFRAVDSQFARESLAAIQHASRSNDRVDSDWLGDDQPFRALRSEVRSSFFSDPLTRWDVSAGANSLSAPRFGLQRHVGFALIANETVLPWQRLTIDTALGVRRYPDGSSRPIGGLTVRYRRFAATIEHRELLANATALDTHASVTRRAISWTRYVEQSWWAGAEAGSLRYFDRNRGRYLQGYALLPTTKFVHIGTSAAIRDTAENRFELDSVSGSRTSSGDFEYGYRGSYAPYWTPKHLRELRAIAVATGPLRRLTWKAQLEAGIAHDRARGFGPARGATPVPSNIFDFEFARTSHPTRAALGGTMPFANRYRIELTIERNTTAFYAANAIHASLVRYR